MQAKKRKWKRMQPKKENYKRDPVVSTVRYEAIKLCTGSVQDSNGWYLAVLSQYEAVIDVIGSVEGIDAFIH